MVVDYSNRKPVNKNRPRKQPAGIFIVILLFSVSLSFVLGIGTGWFLHKPAANVQQTAQAANASEASQGQQVNPETKAPPGLDPPLTFYETLPKGGKAIIGSGLNPEKSPQNPLPLPLPVMQAAGQKLPAPPLPAKTEVRKEQQKGVAEPAGQQPVAASVQTKPEKVTEEQSAVPKQPENSGRYCVQIASSKEREEAEALKARLAEKGLPVYILESTVKDRGTWYRVRVGRHLSQQAAGELAAKAGSGAIVISE